MEEEKYRQNGQAHLSALNIDIKLNRGQSFLDRGYVPYINCYYSLPTGVYEDKVVGICRPSDDLSEVEISYYDFYYLEKDPGENLNIFYYLEKDPKETLNTRGREETYALFYLGRLSDLYDELKLMNLNPKPTNFNSEKAKKHDKQIKSILENKQELRDRSGLDLFMNEELLADLGGVLALEKAEYPDREISKFLREREYINPRVLECLS